MTEDLNGAMDYLTAKQDGSNLSLMDHIAQTLVKLTDYGADRPIDYFEAFSYILKENRQTEKNPAFSLNEKLGPNYTEAIKVLSRIRANLFPKQKLTQEGEEEDEEQPEGAGDDGDGDADKPEEEQQNENGEFPNLLADMEWVNHFGVGLNADETELLQLALQKLVLNNPIATARFWGKVNCVNNDYYIAEVDYGENRPHEETEEEDKNQEEKEDGKEKEEKEPRAPIEEDSGPNQFSYFVCTCLGKRWVHLPDIKPHQIVQSRSIRQRFSGDLKAAVLAPPNRFDGNEATLLRAFIARVTHSTTLAPKGKFMPEEEPEDEEAPLESNAPIQETEEWVGKPISDPEASFVHRLPFLLPQGRTEFWSPEAEDEDEDEKEKENVNIEKGPPILRPIGQDELIGGVTVSWSVRTDSIPKKLFWLRSNAWPGLSIVSSENGDRMVTMYFGTGMKVEGALEWPPEWKPKPKPVPPKEEEEKEEEENKTEQESNPEGDTEEKNNEKVGSESETGTYDDSGYTNSNA